MFKKVNVNRLDNENVSLEDVFPEVTQLSKVVSFSEAIKELLTAHHKTQKTLLFWGNSGYGKSSTVISYAKENSYRLIKIQCIALDPLTVSFPVEKGGVMKFIPCEWMETVCNTTEPTVLLFDEANKFSNPSVENMLNSLFLDREYNGHKISDSVLIVGTLNFKALSNTAQELDFSIINRATNILFAPDKVSIISNLQSDTAKRIAQHLPISCSGEEEFQEEVLDRLHVNDNETSARQIDDLAHIFDKSMLSDKALELLCTGRLGDRKGSIAFNSLKIKSCLTLTKGTFDKILELYNKGELQLVKTALISCTNKRLLQEFYDKVDRSMKAFIDTQLKGVL